MNTKQYSKQIEQASQEFDFTGHNVKFEHITPKKLNEVCEKHSVKKQTLMNVLRLKYFKGRIVSVYAFNNRF